jgi:hypothetical protein
MPFLRYHHGRMSLDKFTRVMQTITSRWIVLREFMDYYGTLKGEWTVSELRRLTNLVPLKQSTQVLREVWMSVRFG